MEDVCDMGDDTVGKQAEAAEEEAEEEWSFRTLQCQETVRMQESVFSPNRRAYKSQRANMKGLDRRGTEIVVINDSHIQTASPWPRIQACLMSTAKAYLLLSPWSYFNFIFIFSFFQRL